MLLMLLATRSWRIALAAFALAAAQSSAAPPPSHQTTQLAQIHRVPVADSEIALYVSGSGGPPVVFLAGYGGDHRTWEIVQPRVSEFSLAISYDRPGWGASSPSKRPRIVSNFVEELREALRRAGIFAPYVLVGHSYGGTTAKLFASRYPHEVAGLVLVDPGMEGFYRRASVEAPTEYLHELEEVQADADSASNETKRREFLGFDTSMQQLRVAPAVKIEKVVLLTAQEIDLPPRLQAVWLDEQARWAKAVGARHVYVKSGHRIPRQVPDSVVSAVRSVLGKAPVIRP